MLYIILIAVSLAMDAFAVSVSAGLTVKPFGWRQALTLGCWFGAFQCIMPLIGLFLGMTVSQAASGIGPYIACAVLLILGGKMIYEGLHPDSEPQVTQLTAPKLLTLAVATSIDALAVGVTFAFMEVNPWSSALIIGVVAFGLSVLGGMLGRKIGDRVGPRAGILGGVILAVIGIKILLEHLLG
ncbi:MAG: manganese efflux pump [Oscillospiraceae bacterium]|nr:manganese efflux pump [Oscillospiraceae bacterium]